MSTIKLEDCILGQYEGYADDPTIENKDTNCPTFATIKFNVNTPRWHGVPFIMKAGKALDERKAEMRIQFKDAPAATFLFQDECPRNELGKHTEELRIFRRLFYILCISMLTLFLLFFSHAHAAQ
jgi:glucose-6-phosphate 1-dehydrogenase